MQGGMNYDAIPLICLRWLGPMGKCCAIGFIKGKLKGEVTVKLNSQSKCQVKMPLRLNQINLRKERSSDCVILNNLVLVSQPFCHIKKFHTSQNKVL